MSGRCGWHWAAQPGGGVAVFIWTKRGLVCRAVERGARLAGPWLQALPWEQQRGWAPRAARGCSCLPAPVTPALRLWAACEAHTVPGHEQNCKPEVRRTTAPLRFGGIGYILFFPPAVWAQSGVKLCNCCFHHLAFSLSIRCLSPFKCRYSSKYA